ncbi:MAG TPA: Gfo/Idh/MocA family oxidoreductase [Candidatus Angelobacter sp.]
MSTVNVAIIGCGYWGQNLVRNFSEVDGAELKTVCDMEEKALKKVQRRFPNVQLSQSFEEVLADPAIDAVVIATPISTHYSYAQQALLAGKHVLVEKPMATSAGLVLDLMETADRVNKKLMVDHTFLYTSAVRKMKQLIDAGEIGDLLYFDSIRINLGLVQSDTNVLWDLGPHDFSIMDYLCDLEPKSVSASAVKHLHCPHDNIAYVTVRFANNLIAHFHLNWLAPVKVRTTIVGGSKKMLVYDDMQNSEKIKVFDRGITANHDPNRRERMLTGYRNGDILVPNLEQTEALRLMAQEFINSIREDRKPLTDGASAYRVVRLLEAAQRSIEQNGRAIDLDLPGRLRVERNVPAAVGA